MFNLFVTSSADAGGLESGMNLLSEFVFYFWTWWYWDNLRLFAKRVWVLPRFAASSVGLGVHFENIFVPLYQQYSFEGRLVSFLFRATMVLLGVSLQLLVLPIVAIALAIYLIAPVLPLVELWGIALS